MPRVIRVKRARKKQGKCEHCQSPINKGDPYVWWKFRFGRKHVRCVKPECAPKAADLTQSAFLSALYTIQDSKFEADTFEGLESERDDIVSEIENLRDETQEKFDNMPEGLQQGDTGQLLQERIDACEEAANEIQGVDCAAPEKEDEETDEAFEKRLEEEVDEKRTELEEALGNFSPS